MTDIKNSTDVQCRKYKTSRQHILQTERAYLAAFLERQMPGAQFRFITFEKDDYRSGGITFIMCNLIPETVMIEVAIAADLQRAIGHVIGLNPSVRWDEVDFIYPPVTNFGAAGRYVQLRFTGLPMMIDAAGLRSSGEV